MALKGWPTVSPIPGAEIARLPSCVPTPYPALAPTYQPVHEYGIAIGALYSGALTDMSAASAGAATARASGAAASRSFKFLRCISSPPPIGDTTSISLARRQGMSVAAALQSRTLCAQGALT